MSLDQAEQTCQTALHNTEVLVQQAQLRLHQTQEDYASALETQDLRQKIYPFLDETGRPRKPENLDPSEKENLTYIPLALKERPLHQAELALLGTEEDTLPLSTLKRLAENQGGENWLQRQRRRRLAKKILASQAGKAQDKTDVFYQDLLQAERACHDSLKDFHFQKADEKKARQLYSDLQRIMDQFSECFQNLRTHGFQEVYFDREKNYIDDIDGLSVSEQKIRRDEIHIAKRDDYEVLADQSQLLLLLKTLSSCPIGMDLIKSAAENETQIVMGHFADPTFTAAFFDRRENVVVMNAEAVEKLIGESGVPTVASSLAHELRHADRFNRFSALIKESEDVSPILMTRVSESDAYAIQTVVLAQLSGKEAGPRNLLEAFLMISDSKSGFFQLYDVLHVREIAQMEACSRWWKAVEHAPILKAENIVHFLTIPGSDVSYCPSHLVPFVSSAIARKGDHLPKQETPPLSKIFEKKPSRSPGWTPDPAGRLNDQPVVT